MRSTCSHFRFRLLLSAVTVVLLFLISFSASVAQRKTARRKSRTTQTPATSELAKLRKQYIETTKEYKASLDRLLALYQTSVRKAQDRQVKSKELFKEGLISKNQLDESEQAVTAAQLKVTEVEQQMTNADSQIAQTLLEVEGERQIARLGPLPKGGLIKTTSFIRYNGVGLWSLSQAGKVELFFQQTFKRPLPIAVFGQGAIHDRWRLDHHNAMDVSVNPDGAEGQALMEFLRVSGIPFSAFRAAIPGVATGPHIHIGSPSHHY